MTGTSFEAITRAIHQATDIVQLIAENVRLVHAGKDLKGLCPFHQEKTPSFYVSPTKQIFKCFGCGAGGDVFKYVQRRENLSFSEARAILASRAGIELKTTGPARDNDGVDRPSIMRANDWAARWFQRQLMGPMGDSARQYVEKRGLTPESCERFGLGLAPADWSSLLRAATQAGIGEPLLLAAGLVKRSEKGDLYDTFRDRLMFPIRDPMKRAVGFGGRALNDDPAKYLNTPQTDVFDKSRLLFGLEIARDAIQASGKLLVVEGYLDCIMAHQFGFGHCVASMGTALTAAQVEILRRYAEQLVLVFDSDEAGERAADRALPSLLSQRLGVRIARVPSGKDPCDYLLAEGAAAFDGVLNSALDALEFKWRQTLQRCRGEEAGPGRARAIGEFLQIVTAAAAGNALDVIQRGLIANQVGRLLGLAPDKVFHTLPGAESAKPNAPRTPIRAARPTAPSQAAASAATRELLEVLLNEPGYYDNVRDCFDPAILPDDVSRRIGRLFVSLAATQGEVRAADLLAQLETLEAADRLVDMQLTGARRGNFAETIAGARHRLALELCRTQADGLGLAMQEPAVVGADDELVRSALDSARRHRHFASRRHLNRTFPQGGRENIEPGRSDES